MKTIPRGVPSFAEDQRSFVLRKLREAGEHGVSRSTFIFEYRVSQCGAWVDELKRAGYRIESELRPGERYVCYVLCGEPAELKPLPALQQKSLPWGKRPRVRTDKQGRALPPGETIGPLFAGVH